MRTATLQAWRSRLGSAGFLSGLVFVAMAAKGDGCVPEPDPGGQEECTQPADCDGLAHIACVGQWTCEQNQCAWDCHVEPPTGCYSDAECPSGFECNSDTVCLPPPGCSAGQPCPAVCYGECVKKEGPPPTCTGSEQCPSGTHCSTDDGVCNPACASGSNSAGEAPQGDMAACPAVCTGECVDNSTWCFSDTECKTGQWCDRSECGGTAPATDAAGARIACGGVCRDRDACTSNTDCNAGETCSCVVPTTNAAGAIMACDMRCVPTEPIECYSNAECPANTHCSPDCQWLPSDSSGAGEGDRAAEYCPSHCVPDRTCGDQGQVCGPNEVCSSECWADPVDCNCTGDAPCDCPAVATCEAKCVPQDGSCQSNLDCKPGYYCGCGPFDAANASGLMVCNLTCLPEATECRSDADCGGDFYCNVSQCSTDAKRPCAPDDASCGGGAMPPAPACTGTCEPRPSMCSTNADCGSGYECVIDVCAGSSDPDGGASEFMCWGHCQVVDPKPYECWADTDCGTGGWCEYDYMNCTSNFAPQPDGDMPMPMPNCGGWCHYADPIPCDPWGDMACPEGTECQMVSGCGGMTPVPASGVPCMANYQCVPVVKPECRADCDCAFGYGCVAGTCQVQEPIGPCDDAWMCKDGYTCGCPTRFGGPASGVACFPQCYPERPECCDDSQCAGGEMCVGGACEPMYCYDQKCPEGYHCESQCGGPVPAGGLMACPMVCVKDVPACATDCDCDAWTACINGACQVADRMNECHGGQCMTNADCGPGSYCKVDYYAGCDSADAACAIMPVGYCVPEVTPIPCGPNEACPAGTACTCTPSPSCPECDVCYMQCMPVPPDGCQSNADCGDGGVCRLEPYACPCSIDENGKVICPDCGPPADARGWCEYPPKETLCGPNGECPSGFACNECAHGSCPMCDDCVAVCEPKVDLGCRADADCATGERCDFKACTAAGACAPGMDCAVCVGQCVPNEDTNPCFATGCSGQICAAQDVMSTCEFLPWYACYKLASCGQDAAGACGWSQTPEFLKCMEEMGGFSSAGGAPQ